MKRSKSINRLSFSISVIAALLFSGCFLFSLCFFRLNGAQKIKRVLFFPMFESIMLNGEERFLPKKATVEEDIELLLKELILGPKNHQNLRIVPQGVTVESVMLRDQELYINLSEDILLRESPSPLNLDETLQALGNTIFFNVPKLRDIFIFVSGQLPGEYNNVDHGLRYSKSIVL